MVEGTGRNAITAKKGEPGCRRHQEDRLLHNVMSGLRVGSCGNENRDAFAGRSHRGFRSQEATNRRIQKRNDRRKDARQSYRAFYAKGSGRDEADHGLLQPPAPQPKQAVYDRSQMLLKSSGCATNNASISRAVLSTAVAPCKLRSSALKLASWNVEGMREIGKYDQVFAFMQKPSVHILVLAMQETHSECSQEFSKSGYLVLHSSSPKAPKHGVGFIIAPRPRPYVHSFLPLGPRLRSHCISFVVMPRAWYKTRLKINAERRSFGSIFKTSSGRWNPRSNSSFWVSILGWTTAWMSRRFMLVRMYGERGCHLTRQIETMRCNC